MPEFRYTFEIEEKVIKRCSIVVEASTLVEAMGEVEEQGPWEWDVHYGKDLSYDAEELMENEPTNADNWEYLSDAH